MATTFTAFPREEFRALVESLLDKIPVIWEGTPQKFIGPRNGKPGTLLKLDVKRVQSLGRGSVRKTWNPSAAGGQGANQVEVGGQRVYYLLFRVESFSFDVPGYDPLEDLKLKFRFASTLAQLQAMNVAYVGSGDVVPVDYNTDNRPEFAAVCEFKFSFAVTQSVTDDQGGIIEHVNETTSPIPSTPTVGTIPFVEDD